MSEGSRARSRRNGKQELDQRNRWRARPLLAAGLKVAVVAVPVLGSLVAAWAVSSLLPTGTGTGRWGYRAIIVGAALIAAMLSERVARRLLPMTALLKLSLLFPDQAPSRLKVARRATSTQRLSQLAAHRRGDAMNAASTILELLAALASHDKRTRGHAERVRVYTDLLAEQLRLSRDDQDRLRWAALLHDIGKLAVDPAILNKPGKPNEREWNILRAHPDQGSRAAAALLPWLGEWGAAIIEHHERFDGTGYPKGLTGGAISRAGRAIAVVDAYEVMTAARSYKRPTSTLKAREELAECAGQHFDPAMVKAFLAISLPRLLWATGPLSFLVQLPFIGVLRDAGTKLAGAGGPAIVAATTGAVVVATSGTPTVAAATAPQLSRSPVHQAQIRSTAGNSSARRKAPPSRSSPALLATPVFTPITSVVGPSVWPAPARPAPPTQSDTPVVVIPLPTALPAVTITNGPVASTSSTDPVVAFDVSDAQATVTCRLDGGPATHCSNPWTAFDVALGTHKLAVTAANSAGSTTAAYRWTIAATPAPPPAWAAPTTAVTSGPVASSSFTDAVVTFAVSDPAATVACSLDGAPATTCNSPWSATNLAVGTHTLTINASNAGGTGTAVYSWTITAPPVSAPAVTVTNGPAAATGSTDATVDFTVNDPTATVMCSLDGGIPAACTNTWTVSNLAAGSHTLTIDATNSAGTGTASYTWTITTPPPPPIGAPTVTTTSGPVPASTSSSAVINFTVSDPNATVMCSLDGAASAGCSSPWSASNLTIGTHILTIAATNAGGTGTATYTWTVTAPQVPAPTVTVTAGPVPSSTSTDATINFTVSDLTATVACSLDGATAALCANPWSGTNLPVGSHTVTIAATNSVGTGTATYTWSVTTAPTLPTAVVLTQTPPTVTSTKAAMFSWSTDPGLTYECSLDGAAFTSCVTAVTYTKLKPAIHTFRIHSTNTLGVSGTDTVYTWQVK